MKYLIVYLLTGVPLLTFSIYSAIRDSNEPPPELPPPLAGQIASAASAANAARRRAVADAEILTQLQGGDLLGREAISDDDGSDTSAAMVDVLRAWRGVQRTRLRIEKSNNVSPESKQP